MGTALSTTGNKHHTPCLIGVAISPLNPNLPHLGMGSSSEENAGGAVYIKYSKGVDSVYTLEASS